MLAVDHWRSEHQQHFRGWVDAWAEFEALQAIAGYAFEQTGTVFLNLSMETQSSRPSRASIAGSKALRL